MSESVEQQVIDFIAAWCDVPSNTITVKTTFEGLGIAGEDKITLIMELEDSFGLTYADGDENGITTVGDAVAMIKSKLGG